ncbi:MAG: hypothetical protein JWN44_6483 [Myxococcales bacterium]|nr:hypothetical protein [Myxococcales bacterium]
MRAASAPLIALLNSASQVFVADLLTITQQSGTVTRLTDAVANLTAVSQIDNATHTWTSSLPFSRGRTKIVVGLEVDTLALTLMPDPLVHTLGGVPWPAAVRAGALDEARVVLERLFMATAGDTSAGTLIQFAGRVGEVTPSRGSIEIQVRSDLELLTAQLPRNVYQPGCLHTLYDAGCTLAKAAFQSSSTAQSGSTAASIVTGLSRADGYYALGTVTFTSGANAGLTRTVRTYLSNVAVPIVAFPSVPAVGDAFTIAAGCDKQQATCSSKFGNLTHFRGLPYIPLPESGL